MTINERAIQAVYRAIEELNGLLPENQRLEKSVDTQLTGQGGKLDSLALVNLIVLTEEKVEDEFDTPVSLTDEKLLSEENGPFKSVGSLIAYICLLLEKKHND
jgi:acyl carrier protein